MKAKYKKLWLEYLMLGGALDDPTSNRSQTPAPQSPQEQSLVSPVVRRATPNAYLKAYHDAIVATEALLERKSEESVKHNPTVPPPESKPEPEPA